MISINRLKLVVLGLAGLAATGGCVASRPSRNGVFNENQYLRKAWLVRDSATDATGAVKKDNGWMLQATVTDVSSPNPLGGDIFGIFPGTASGGSLVRFQVTQDKLSMVNMRELTTKSSVGRTGSIDNAWGVTNVDLKYRVNLDGETTNFYEENQEAPWQDRQYLKVNFAKNDMSDIAPLGPFTNDAVTRCTDIANASATLVNDSFVVDERDDYMEWAVSVTLPLKFDDAACVEAYDAMGDVAERMGRYSVTLNLKYSLKRAESDEAAAKAYTPLVLDEKDPIRHKYGPIEYVALNRDEDSGQVAAKEYVVRFNPKTPKIVWYFEQGFPQDYKAFFTAPGGIAEQTNKILEDAHADARVEFREADDPQDQPPGISDFPEEVQARLKVRKFGDVRYNFLRWVNDRDMQPSFAGVTQFFIDPRSGETKNSTIVFNDFAIKDYYVQRIDAYLQSIGASADVNSPTPWPDPPGGCKDGDTLPVDPNLVTLRKNASSSLFGKIQQYLQKPIAQYGNLAPSAFVPAHDASSDFEKAYYSIAGYNIFADPDSNFFVTREGGAGVYGPADIWKRIADESEFHKRAAQIDRGQVPFDDPTGPNGFMNALGFMNRMKELTRNHQKLSFVKPMLHASMHKDSPDAFSLETVIARDARRCVNGHYETKEEWVKGLIDTYWSQVAWHEFGHAMGLEHNFMASVDKPNFPDPKKDSKGQVRYGLYASSVMEYNSTPDRVFWTPGWAPYDRAAIGFIYANDAKKGDSSASALSGQKSASEPWVDPYGFNGSAERQFLRCSETHQLYTPLCRAGDLGTTPTQIVANAIEDYEWQYAWRNFRVYRKFWNNARYADSPAGLITDMKRFISMWAYDWSEAELTGTLHRIGIDPPKDIPAQHYYDQLTHEFTIEMSAANALVAAFHKAVIQQSSGERPYATVYDRFYGDELQQGIILDKFFAMESWVGLWPTDNYDQNQAGAYIASYSDFGEPQYRTIAEDAVTSMVGTQYDVYPYFIPSAVALFAQDTHSPSFTGRLEVRDWVGGLTFTRREDFADYFKKIAVDKGVCANIPSCTYDVTSAASTKADTWNEFHGPDGIIYIWSYVPNRNVYVLARKDRNIATYKILHQYNDDILKNLDDGSGSAFNYESPIKYTLDSFHAFN